MKNLRLEFRQFSFQVPAIPKLRLKDVQLLFPEPGQPVSISFKIPLLGSQQINLTFIRFEDGVFVFELQSKEALMKILNFFAADLVHYRDSLLHLDTNVLSQKYLKGLRILNMQEDGDQYILEVELP